MLPMNVFSLNSPDLVNGLSPTANPIWGLALVPSVAGSIWYQHIYQVIQNVTVLEHCQAYCMLEFSTNCQYLVHDLTNCYLGVFNQTVPVIGVQSLAEDVYIKHNGNSIVS